MTDRWQHVSRLYHAALAHEAPTRAAFLQQACVGDEMLQHEVESLLAHEEAVADFIETPALHAAASLGGTQADVLAMPGGQIGAYRILSLLGVGGMGEVYRARDTKLGRDVAIKILPSLFTHDSDRRARLEREARMLAALNHPNIGAIYGFEEAEGIRFLVLELVEGRTVADTLADVSRQRSQGPGLPVRDALRIARQIAEALDFAHEKGIVHRDLKPANITITPDGAVKVLDFGLAKAAGDSSTPKLTHSTAQTLNHTSDGAVMGTPGYMSPEQARGQAVDKRTDIWAFGCVLYEMLTGRVAFKGETAAGTIVAVLENEPESAVTAARNTRQRPSAAAALSRQGRGPASAEHRAGQANDRAGTACMEPLAGRCSCGSRAGAGHWWGCLVARPGSRARFEWVQITRVPWTRSASRHFLRTGRW